MRALHALAVLALLAGCEPIDDSGDPSVPTTASVVRTYQAATTDADGLVTVTVPLEAGMSRFMVTGFGAGNVNVEEIRSPSGATALYWEDWWETEESLTYGIYPQLVSAVNWPIREQDGPLAAGDWEVVLATTDNNWDYQGNVDLEVAVHRVADPSLAAASVKVRIVWAQNVQQSEHIVDSVETAVETWREVWAANGLTLRETYETSNLSDGLPWAYKGSDLVKGVAASGDQQALILVIGEIFPDGADTFGVSAGLPGSLESTRNKYVALSWLAHAGANALFDDDERRMMGETMAHEVGHFMGLFHPVEDGYDSWDALGDTDKCRNERACISALGANNMFPYPLCGFDTCEPQQDVTQAQRGVLQRHVGAL